MTVTTAALNTSSSSLPTTLTVEQAAALARSNALSLNGEDVGVAFPAKFAGTCALSGATFYQYRLVRMVKLPGWDKARCVSNDAYGVFARNGWQRRDESTYVWTGRLLASQVTAEEVMGLLRAGHTVRTFEVGSIINGGPGSTDHRHTWTYDATANVYKHTGLGGAMRKTPAQLKNLILNKKVWALEVV